MLSARARDRREHRALHRAQRPALHQPAGQGPAHAGSLPICRAQRHGRPAPATTAGQSRRPTDGQNVRTTFSYPMYRQFVTDNRTLVDLFACMPHSRINVVVDGQADSLTVCSHRELLLDPWRQRPARARHRARRRSRDRTTGCGDQLRSTGTSASARIPPSSARSVKVNNVPVTIVGVLPPEFTGVQQPLDGPADLSFPLALQPQLETSHGDAPNHRSRPTGGCRSWDG